MSKFNKKLFLFSFFFLIVLIFSTEIASAATLNLSPSSGSFNVGDTINVRVVLSSPTESANAVSGVIDFPKALLTLTSISKSNSLVSLWAVEPSYSNTSGTASMEGVILSGYRGSNGTILTLSFKAKATGSANIKFTSYSILANDGQGTSIGTGTGQANFTLSPLQIKTPVIKTDPKPAPVPVVPVAEIVVPPVVVLTPVFTDYSKQIKEGEFVVVKGLADPLTDIVITSDLISPDTEKVVHATSTVKSNDQGLFLYAYNNTIPGIYIINAQARNKDGVQSEKSLPIKISVVRPSTEIPVAKNLTNIFSTVIPVVGLIVLLILLMIWGWHHILHYREHMKKRFADMRDTTSKSFSILDEDVKEELKVFKKIKALETLTPDERNFINQFKKDIEAAEKTILKEIKE